MYGNNHRLDIYQKGFEVGVKTERERILNRAIVLDYNGCKPGGCRMHETNCAKCVVEYITRDDRDEICK